MVVIGLDNGLAPEVPSHYLNKWWQILVISSCHQGSMSLVVFGNCPTHWHHSLVPSVWLFHTLLAQHLPSGLFKGGVSGLLIQLTPYSVQVRHLLIYIWISQSYSHLHQPIGGRVSYPADSTSPIATRLGLFSSLHQSRCQMGHPQCGDPGRIVTLHTLSRSCVAVWNNLLCTWFK